MKKNLIFLVVVIVIAISIVTYIKTVNPIMLFSSNEQLKPLTKKEMIEDFDYMYNILSKNYPFFK